jgi:hypothetical protein
VTEFEAFNSNQTHLVVFRAGLAAVSRVGYDEALAQNVGALTGHAMTAAFGPVGFLLSLAAHAEELHRDPSKPPVLEPILMEELLSGTEPASLLYGQLEKELRRHAKWPAAEWFRPVVVFPRGCLVRIEVKWTSAVHWNTASEAFRTEVNFWRVSKLRRKLADWAYPLQ